MVTTALVWTREGGGHVREIGIRELKQHLSETLRAVERGEVVRVTLRGRPLVEMVPAGTTTANDRLRQLVDASRITPPSRRLPARAPRLAPAARPASELALADRDAEG